MNFYSHSVASKGRTLWSGRRRMLEFLQEKVPEGEREFYVMTDSVVSPGGKSWTTYIQWNESLKDDEPISVTTKSFVTHPTPFHLELSGSQFHYLPPSLRFTSVTSSRRPRCFFRSWLEVRRVKLISKPFLFPEHSVSCFLSRTHLTRDLVTCNLLFQSFHRTPVHLHGSRVSIYKRKNSFFRTEGDV